jgi:hypothetical protein
VDDALNATRAAVEEGSYPGRHHQQQRTRGASSPGFAILADPVANYVLLIAECSSGRLDLLRNLQAVNLGSNPGPQPQNLPITLRVFDFYGCS